MKYRRILIKLSGEALADEGLNHLFNFDKIHAFAKQINALITANIEVAIVIGAGNILRGSTLSSNNDLDKVNADYMGMVATHINAIALADILTKNDCQISLMSAYPLSGTTVFNPILAKHHMREGRVLILSGGTGNPCVTTDTCAAIRAIELNVDVLVKATKVEGIYAQDPVRFPDAKFFPHLTYREALEKRLDVMDMASYLLCSDHDMPLIVLNIFKQSILATLKGQGQFSLLNNND